MIRAMLLILTLAALPLPAMAHKVIFAVFKSGETIEGELGFSNGDMAPNARIEVFSDTDEVLGEAVTDADGFFLFTPTQPVRHVFKANLGAGHIAETDMSAEDVADILGVAAIASETSAAAAPVTTNTGTVVASLSPEERLAIAEAVRDEIRPLRREIAAYREKNDLQTVLGGIGYIMGLFGLYFYIAARRRMQG
ncbi:cobalt ABC transporter permease [Donghicola tyrosinivorans]|uniref:Nickel transport protein n=1 Tax=Donghicola tyrosinivorans TaxID=1652492 RepID=A0A2T0WNK9_9RHOB|nr:cobalt ABC transporter permease [Donghicola tyrosinivorans]PRY88270.1 nickel transport protein [Donghicola tyrosinivorans]